MKTLILLRHGKAEHYDARSNDFDRELVEKGKNNSADMGKFILNKTGTPELILASRAVRTMETALFAAENLNYPKDEIQNDIDLYLASAHEILKSISKIPDKIKSCLLVGHNPGLTDLINYFGVWMDNLPTASAICFEFDAERWHEVSPETGTFCWIQSSKDL